MADTERDGAPTDELPPVSDDGQEPGEESPLSRYRLELEAFQGPLDLLLHLIRKDRLDIYDIPIAEVTAQYLAYLDLMQEMDLDVASEFLVMASTLVYIKSRMLLPQEGEDEEAEEEDPREELVRRLLEYQKYRKAAEDLGRRPMLDADVFSRPETEAPRPAAEAYVEATLFNLMDAFARVLADADRRRPHEVERDAFTMEEGIEYLQGHLAAASGSVDFADLFADLATRRRIVTVFMALLELIKRGAVAAIQAEHGGPIHLVASSCATPPPVPEDDVHGTGTA